MPPLKWRKLFWILIAVWGAINISCAFFNGIVQIIIAVIAMIFLCVIVILGFIFWRCPTCKRFLPRGLFIEYCSYCGEPLDTDDKNTGSQDTKEH
ncbi:hypothetical protein SAMN05192585_12238 [Acetanaerobacterium elongatum]|uniref:Zinc-ribbon containing domain-containing protein n=1 Tax=Acetanaerobacterium elongatum TaxID=258515 RepID=A0A1H0CA88_9FIRM|nr:hypothetical protein SAMN05192585_12238 [Acetanaerobacterium elongatum]